MTDTIVSPSPTTKPTKTKIEISPRVSRVLQEICGPWSEEMAIQFPYPHLPALSLSGPWLTVFGLIFANPISANRNARVVFDYHRDWRDAAHIGSPRFTQDNVCVLKKLSLPLWSREEYRLFTPLLDCPRAVKLMMHADLITPSLVRTIAHLPAEFRVKKIVDFLLHHDESKLLSRLFDHRNDEDKNRIVSSLKSTKNRTDFWRKASQHFFHGFGEFPGVLEIDDDRFESVRTLRRLQELGKLHGNCMGTSYAIECLSGHTGFLVFHGSEVAIISYKSRLGNRYIIDEIHGPENTPVDDETIAEIEKLLKGYGFVWGSNDPTQTLRFLDNRMHRLALAEHDMGAQHSTQKISELLDQVEQFQSVG